MATLEEEVLEKFGQLDPAAKQRVRIALDSGQIHQVNQSDEVFDFDAWIARVEKIREQIRQENGGVFPQMDVVQMLHEIRDGNDE